MIVFRYPIYNAAGNVRLNPLPESQLDNHSRRINRRATINGGVYFDDQGFSHGDRTLSISVPRSTGLLEKLKGLISTYALYHCITAEGAFTGTIQRIDERTDILTITFLIKNKES